jgi:chromosome segregation ATPase
MKYQQEFLLNLISSEQEILRDEIRSLHSMRTRLRLRTDELEAEVKALREEIENAHKAAKSEEEEDVPLSQRKRFTRVEMARVLMERNQYKERWMELQEAVTSKKNCIKSLVEKKL